MAMDADSFSLMLAEPAELRGFRGPARKRALWLCAKHYRDGMSAAELEATVHQCGSVIGLIVIEAIIGGIISWAVTRFLDWWFDKKSNGKLSGMDRMAVLRQIREQTQ
jgi:hypothetical protein